MYKCLSLIAALFTLAMGEVTLTITNPFGSIVWNGNSNGAITWIYAPDGGKTVSTVNLNLCYGPNTTINCPIGVTTGIQATAQTFTYAVPNDIPSRSDYYIEIAGTTVNPAGTYKQYSGRFQIVTTGASQTTTTTATTSPTASPTGNSANSEAKLNGVAALLAGIAAFLA